MHPASAADGKVRISLDAILQRKLPNSDPGNAKGVTEASVTPAPEAEPKDLALAHFQVKCLHGGTAGQHALLSSPPPAFAGAGSRG